MHCLAGFRNAVPISQYGIRNRVGRVCNDWSHPRDAQLTDPLIPLTVYDITWKIRNIAVLHENIGMEREGSRNQNGIVGCDIRKSDNAIRDNDVTAAASQYRRDCPSSLCSVILEPHWDGLWRYLFVVRDLL